jgi:hypothetical protein
MACSSVPSDARKYVSPLLFVVTAKMPVLILITLIPISSGRWMPPM